MLVALQDALAATRIEHEETQAPRRADIAQLKQHQTYQHIEMVLKNLIEIAEEMER